MSVQSLDPRYALMQAFRDDCSRLIARFEKLATVRYDGFCEIWQDMKFSLVFVGRNTYIETLEFCEESLAIAKEFFLPPFLFKERIGGLYLLYGLYFKMPVEGPKIRLRLAEWLEVVELRAEIGLAEHHDASFILSKLMSVNAFIHSFMDQELGLEKNYRLKTGGTANPYSLLPEIRELAVPDDLFDRINVLSKHYESIKPLGSCEPSTSSTTGDSRRDLRLYDSNLGQKLIESVKQLENQRTANKKSRLTLKPTRRKQPIPSEPTSDPSRKKRLTDSIRHIVGHGFCTDSSPSEDEGPRADGDNCGSMPDFFDESDVSD